MTTGIYAIQSKKSNSLWPKRIWDALAAIKADGLVPVLIVKDSPGPGRKERGIVVMTYEGWLDTTGVKA